LNFVLDARRILLMFVPTTLDEKVSRAYTDWHFLRPLSHIIGPVTGLTPFSVIAFESFCAVAAVYKLDVANDHFTS
jgi:hypothetical protein